MNIIRQIKREVTETKERMVPELYEETSTQEFFVVELDTAQLEMVIGRLHFSKNCESYEYKQALVKQKELREIKDGLLEQREIR